MDRLEELLITAAREVPDRVAVIDQEASWTYAHLDAYSDWVARRLARVGIGAGSRVGVWAPKSCRAVAVLQGVLRLGAAYVPIDPAMPALRAERILTDCDVQLVATTDSRRLSLATPWQIYLVDRDEQVIRCSEAPQGERVSPPVAMPDQLAYILYTSGSTGEPKGACFSHRNALAFIKWAVRAVALKGPTTVASHAAFNFDLSVFDLYATFLSTSTVRLVPEAVAYSARALVTLLSAEDIAYFYTVPSVLMLMIEHGGLLEAQGPVPDVVIFAGEPLPVSVLRGMRAHWPRTRLFNFYGPTETNVCTAHEVGNVPHDQITPAPIGRASCGNQVWAMTDEGTIAKEGEIGELYVDGPTVMLGYWGRTPQTGPYKTGDLCVLRGDGTYDFIGRRDHMIKVRGHRVEPGEIEATLIQHPNVERILVLPVGEGRKRRLVAFVVPRRTPPPTLLELKQFAAARLPAYMLIDRIELMDALPTTPNGKIDRLTLVQRFARSL